MIATIKVPSSVTVRSAATFAGSLLEAARSNRDVAIDPEALVECDLSFVQLVLALRTHLAGAGGTLRLTRPAGPALCALLDRAGFGAPTPADAQFWFHGERPQ
ncbi:STAS domain-containing protein [Sphingomonas sp. PAMC 26617]|uniref:STAS domain-containing protein n=1 Tax=Sphingomonas sp. PAMC 26617 TaxID=1112216 RepID=UPI000289FD10|nr:STAS domain-containing protein [Sphingomonas sp. PAMC 26617]